MVYNLYAQKQRCELDIVHRGGYDTICQSNFTSSKLTVDRFQLQTAILCHIPSRHFFQYQYFKVFVYVKETKYKVFVIVKKLNINNNFNMECMFIVISLFAIFIGYIFLSANIAISLLFPTYISWNIFEHDSKINQVFHWYEVFNNNTINSCMPSHLATRKWKQSNNKITNQSKNWQWSIATVFFVTYPTKRIPKNPHRVKSSVHDNRRKKGWHILKWFI